MNTIEELLRKATQLADTSGAAAALPGSGGDFAGTGQAPLSIEQVREFLKLMAAPQVMLSKVRTVTSGAAKWQESILAFTNRIARGGIEGVRLADTTNQERTKPLTGIVEISTVLLRAEIPVSDEVIEDNVEGSSLVTDIEALITDRFGLDIEELMMNADPTSADNYLTLLPNGGWVYQAKNGKYGGNGIYAPNAVDSTSIGQDYQEIFRRLISAVPVRYLRGIRANGAYFVPERLAIKYRDLLASRGTSYGDIMLTGQNELTYQGIPIVGVPALDLAGDVNPTAGSASTAQPTAVTTSNILLSDSSNLYAGFHRQMKFETWRDPREGVTSFIVTARVDAEVAVPNATSVAYNVDISA
jgi:hypothetical protein